MPWKTTKPSRKSTTAKELADLLVALFASTPGLNYSSEALLVMAQRFQELLDAGVSEEELVAHFHHQLADFSQKLARGTRGRGKGSVLVGPTVVDARLIRSIFVQCPKPPTFPSLKTSLKSSTAAVKKLLAEQQKVERKA